MSFCSSTLLYLSYKLWTDSVRLSDFLSYCMFAFTYFRVPEGLSFGMHVARYFDPAVVISNRITL